MLDILFCLKQIYIFERNCLYYIFSFLFLFLCSTDSGIFSFYQVYIYIAVTQRKMYCLFLFFLLYCNQTISFLCLFAERIFYLGIDGKVISSAPTESIVLNLKKFYEDINLIQKERFLQAFSLTENTKDIPSEDLQKIEAMIYTMADKFLENDDFEHVKEGIRMTRLGQMLFNDGFNDGFNNGSQKKQLEIARNLIGKLSDASIAETTGLPLDVILKLKKEQTMKV